MGLERSLRIIAEFPDRETTVPVMGQALREERARGFATEWLLAAPETRAARELVRGWDALTPAERKRVRGIARSRLLTACQQLIRADRATSRRNVAEVLAGESARLHVDLESVIHELSQLVDDPDPRTRQIARSAFVDALLREPETIAGRVPQDPLLVTLSVLLRNWEKHRDPRVIEALIAAGGGGDAWLERAVGEVWSVTEAIVATVARPHDDLSATRRVELLTRWLDGPLAPARQSAREVLRATEDRRLLRAAAHAIPSLRGEGESPTWRRVRWWRLRDEDFQALPEATIGKLAGFLANSEGEPTDRAERVARLVPLTSGETLRTVLEKLRGLPLTEVLPAITPVLTGDDPDARLIALELLPIGEGASLPWVIAQLASPFEIVRDAATKRLAGQGLRLWREGRGRIPATQQKATLSALRKVDPTFDGQLRRQLAGPDEAEVIAGLSMVREVHEPGVFDETLVDLVVHPSDRVRAGVARAFARAGATTGLHYLKLLLEDPDPRVVANAVESLSELGGNASEPWLRRATEHDHPRVRANALLALGRRGDGEARSALNRWRAESVESARPSAEWAWRQLEEGSSA